ncbi:hypothetical protein [Streptodolium elevatio]|uniref:Uncharacterized protein n=1 Tax=Streptodolium elevatio TaxID=3157996 RepID=A0ABV3DBV5_9ACTN
MALSVWPAPEDSGVVGPTGATGSAGAAGAPGPPGVIQSVNGKSTTAVTLNAADVNALPSNANATLNANELKISAPAGTYRTMGWQTNGTHRWLMLVDNSPETGANAGSNFHITARSDSGEWISTAIHGTRKTGQITFGGEAPFGSAQATVAGAVGLRDLGGDPATVSGGVFLYSKGGVPFFKNADGTSFQVQPGIPPVTSVNDQIGNVHLGAADVGALSTAAGGRVDGPVQISGPAGTNRELSLATSGTNRWSIQADSVVEDGIDNGSNLRIISRTNDGSPKHTVFQVRRATNQSVLGDGNPIGWSRASTSGPHGFENIDWQPEADPTGFQMYAYAGRPYIMLGDGTEFEVGDLDSAMEEVGSLFDYIGDVVQPVIFNSGTHWGPTSLGFLAWSADPATVPANAGMQAAVPGRMYLAGINVGYQMEIGSIGVLAGAWAGSTVVPDARFFAGVYSEDGTRVAWTGMTPVGDLPPLSNPGGDRVLFETDLFADLGIGRYWVAFLMAAGQEGDFQYIPSSPFDFNGFNPPFGHIPVGGPGVPEPFLRAGYLPTLQTTLPETITPSEIVRNPAPILMSVGI